MSEVLAHCVLQNESAPELCVSHLVSHLMFVLTGVPAHPCLHA